MTTSTYGFTLTVDLHGMTVAEARSELLRILKTCPKHIKEIDVIHGYTKGQALQNLIRRDFTHPRIDRKIITMNNGCTTFILK
ncbi:MAG: DNA mismatch repair protein MutS [Clostridiales bacterium]|jgi:DNA-nicking Smr family endonuclease|nr:DNA mismatch repair protein MutS [Clostridiales bacterium]